MVYLSVILLFITMLIAYKYRNGIYQTLFNNRAISRYTIMLNSLMLVSIISGLAAFGEVLSLIFAVVKKYILIDAINNDLLMTFFIWWGVHIFTVMCVLHIRKPEVKVSKVIKKMFNSVLFLLSGTMFCCLMILSLLTDFQ